METLTLAPTSLPSEPSVGIQTRTETKPTGEFARILQNQPDQAGNSERTPPEGQEENQPSAEAEENPLLQLPWLPAFLSEGKNPPGENQFAAPCPGSQTAGNNGSPQILSVPIPAGGTKDTSTAVLEQELVNGDLSPPLEKTLNIMPSSKDGILPAVLPAEISIPENGQANSLPVEKPRVNNAETRLRYNSGDNGDAFEDLKISAKVERTNFESGFWAKEEDLFANDFNLADVSKGGNHKTANLPGSLTSPVDGSTSSRPIGEVRLEGVPASGLSRKPEVYEQVSQKMLWSFSQKEENFRLTLAPPHLGSIYMEIQRDKEQVKATLWAENPHAKQVLESNQISIQKIIESEGFSLESFNVFVEQDLGAFQESRERMRNSEPATSNPAPEVNHKTNAGDAAPNLFVREGGGRLRAIDLII